MNQSVSGV